MEVFNKHWNKPLLPFNVIIIKRNVIQTLPSAGFKIRNNILTSLLRHWRNGEGQITVRIVVTVGDEKLQKIIIRKVKGGGGGGGGDWKTWRI
jgi:hypothetical protein